MLVWIWCSVCGLPRLIFTRSLQHSTNSSLVFTIAIFYIFLPLWLVFLTCICPLNSLIITITDQALRRKHKVMYITSDLPRELERSLVQLSYAQCYINNFC